MQIVKLQEETVLLEFMHSLRADIACSLAVVEYLVGFLPDKPEHDHPYQDKH